MRFLFLFFLFAFSLPVAAQLEGQALVDSLIRELPLAKNDTVKARLYKEIVSQYSNNNPAEAGRYAALGLTHVTGMKWKKGIAVFNNIKGGVFSDMGEYDKAIQLYTKAYSAHMSEKDYYNAASSLNNIGTAYQRQSVMDKAAQNYFEALKLAEKINNKYLIALCLNNIGLIYFNQGDYAKTLDYQGRALKIHLTENNKEGIATSYTTIANTYQQKKDTVNARKYYADAIPLYEQVNNSNGLATVYTNLSNLYRDISVNLDYKLKAQEIWNSLNPAHPISIVNMGNIGLLYLDLARYDSLRKQGLSTRVLVTKTGLLEKATGYLNQAINLSLQTGDMGNYSYLTGIRSELEAEKGDYKKAYYDAKTYHNLNDSIYSQGNKNKIAAIEGQRELAIRDKEIELNKLALAAQRKQRIALFAGIVLLAVIGGLLYRQNRIRKKNNTTLLQLNNELDEANKVKTKFFGILSHDLRSPVSNLINFLHLQKNEPGLLSAEQAAVHETKITASADALLETMEAMLLWSKGQMENFTPQIKKVAIADLFAHIRSFFAGDEKINFQFDTDPDLLLNTDENYMQTIMHNLTTNAINALQQTPGATIVWKAMQKGEQVVLSVTDNGPGMGEEQVKALYDDAAVVHTRNGLGLHIIRDLAKVIRCTITMRSEPGKGTTFTLAT